MCVCVCVCVWGGGGGGGCVCLPVRAHFTVLLSLLVLKFQGQADLASLRRSCPRRCGLKSSRKDQSKALWYAYWTACGRNAAGRSISRPRPLTWIVNSCRVCVSACNRPLAGNLMNVRDSPCKCVVLTFGAEFLFASSVCCCCCCFPVA